MELTLNLSLLLLGITILVWGANKFVDHASVIAKHLGVNDLVIGLTLIAAGTFSSLKRLRIAHLSYNNIRYMDSQSFSYLPHLRFLYLYGNLMECDEEVIQFL